MNLAAYWTKQCVETHALCNKQPTGTFQRVLPKRLIDLGSAIETEPRLCHADTLDPNVQYMTLSHCWGGGANQLKLVKTKASAFLQAIKRSQLPKTFLDAMFITRRLGIRYLWIDSLCIVQDDESDWAAESVKMGDIYQNTYCNIAAAKGDNASAGCFTKRDPLSVTAIRASSPGSQGLPGMPYYCYGLSQQGELMRETSLSRRGWVLQENILSPRKIYFTRKQIFWGCKEMRASETFPGGMPKSQGFEMYVGKGTYRFR